MAITVYHISVTKTVTKTVQPVAKWAFPVAELILMSKFGHNFVTGGVVSVSIGEG